MSWAAIAEKAKAVEQPLSRPPVQVVVAHDPTATESNVVSADCAAGSMDGTCSSIVLPFFSKGLLVLDANAFMKGLDHLLDVADAVVTVSQVVSELRDAKSRAVLERLPYKLHVLDPTTDSVKEVLALAAKTGDAGTMSRTDIRLCALALDCARSSGSLGPKIEPRDAIVNPQAATSSSSAIKIILEEVDESAMGGDANAEQQSSGSDDEGEDNWGEEVDGDAPQANPANGDDDDGEWITPENIAQVSLGTATHNGVVFAGGVACVTSDFAMQNVLMHLGVPIVGPRGMRIRELRLWLLRCHACFRLVSDTTKQFCPECGSGDTLRRVNYVVNDEGEKQLFINFSRKLSTRGTVYNLPKPRGGRRGTNRTLVLREDQLGHVMRGRPNAESEAAKLRQALQANEMDDELAVFGLAPERKKFDANAPKEVSSYRKFNVNERKKMRAARRK